MGRIKVFIINGLPKSGKHTLVQHVGKIRPATKYINSLEYIYLIADKMGYINTNKPSRVDLLFILELKKLWSRYNNKWYHNFIEDLELELNDRLDWDSHSVIFIEVNDRDTIDKLRMTLTTLKIKTKTIIVQREGTKYPSILSHYDLSNNYNIIINNNGTLKQFEKTVKHFINTFITKTKYKDDTIIFGH